MITEVNANNNYLSAGDMPLPSLYFSMSIIYFVTGVLWMYFLYRNTYVEFILVCSTHLTYLISFIKTIYLISVTLYLKYIT